MNGYKVLINNDLWLCVDRHCCNAVYFVVQNAIFHAHLSTVRTQLRLQSFWILHGRVGDTYTMLPKLFIDFDVKILPLWLQVYLFQPAHPKSTDGQLAITEL
jgi:hypothetical protein